MLINYNYKRQDKAKELTPQKELKTEQLVIVSVVDVK